MRLTADEEARALETLHNSGIRGEDATTSLAVLCRRSAEATLDHWLRAHVGQPPTTLQELYGHDATRAAYVLTRRYGRASNSAPTAEND